MAFFDKIFGKKATPDEAIPVDPETRAIRNEIQREKAAMTRQRMQLDLQNARLEAELERIEMQTRLETARAELADLRAQRNPGATGNIDVIDAAVLKLLDKVQFGAPAAQQQQFPLINGQQQLVQPQQAIPAGPAHQFKSYSDAELSAAVAQIPAALLPQAKAMSDDQLAEQIISRAPDMDDDSIDRMIAKIRSA